LNLQGSIPLLTLLPCPKINEVDQPDMDVSSADLLVKPRWSIVAPGDHAAIAVQDKPVENVSCTRA
jgi:hypothetical protein